MVVAERIEPEVTVDKSEGYWREFHGSFQGLDDRPEALDEEN